MLSVVSPSVLLSPVPLTPDDAPHACAPRRKSPAPADGASTAAAAGTAGTPPSSGTTTKAPAKPTTKQPGKTAQSGAAKTTAKPKATASGYAKPASSSARSTSTAKKSGPLAFLDDPNLSMEQKLLKLLGHLNDKWNKELDQKMKEFKQTTTTTSSSGGAGTSSGVSGVLKKAVSYATTALPPLGLTVAALQNPTVRGAVKKLAGPALAAAATAAGQPALAPMALKYGSDVVDTLASAGSSAAGSPKATTRTTTKESAEGLGSDKNDQLRLMEMQRILDQQKEMFSLVSNMLRTTHETRMSLIQNVR